MALTAGRPWQDQQWLAHLCGYGLDVVGGLRLVSLVDACLLVGALLIAMVAARRLGGSPTWTTAIAAPVLLILLPTPVRSQAFAMPLFAALIWLLARDARRADRRIWLVLPLLALWANVHGSVLLGSALRAAPLRDRHRHRCPQRDRRGIGRPLALALAALLAPFASPYGLSLLEYYRATATSGGFHDLIAEWTGTTFRGSPAFFVVAAVAIVCVVRPELRLGLFDALALVMLALAGLDTTRNVVWLPIAAVVLLPAALARWSPEPVSRSRLRPVPRCARARRRAWRRRARGRPHLRIARVGLARERGQRDRRRRRSRPADEGRERRGLRGLAPLAAPRAARTHRLRRPLRVLGDRGLKDMAHLEQAAGGLEPSLRGLRLALWKRSANPELVASLLAGPRRPRARTHGRRVRHRALSLRLQLPLPVLGDELRPEVVEGLLPDELEAGAPVRGAGRPSARSSSRAACCGSPPPARTPCTRRRAGRRCRARGRRARRRACAAEPPRRRAVCRRCCPHVCRRPRRPTRARVRGRPVRRTRRSRSPHTPRCASSSRTRPHTARRALDDPAVVARLGLAHARRRAARRLGEQLADRAHRRCEPPLLRLAEARDERPHPVGRAAVEHGELGATAIRQLHELATSVPLGTPARDQLLRLEPRQHAAQVPRVEIERAPHRRRPPVRRPVPARRARGPRAGSTPSPRRPRRAHR